MASRRHAKPTAYRTYGSVAYAPTGYSGGAVPAPAPKKGEGQPRPKPRTHTRTRKHALTRTKVKVREAGEVAPFAVVGFFLVGICAALLLMGYAQYAMLSDSVVSLRRELSTLQSENATLMAEYEKVFDLEHIQETVGESMTRPTGDQVEYIDLSEPDSVEVYQGGGGGAGILGAVQSLGEIVSEVVEYFR